jgi:hypothetical protein
MGERSAGLAVQAEFCGQLGSELIRLQQPMPDRVPVSETR